jgi:hypothetical protein
MINFLIQNDSSVGDQALSRDKDLSRKTVAPRRAARIGQSGRGGMNPGLRAGRLSTLFTDD